MGTYIHIIVFLFLHESIRYGHSYKRFSLRKPAYSNILKISPAKTEGFQIKQSDIFHISAQNVDCVYSLEPPRRGGSNKYSQSMFLSRTKKIIYFPLNPSFTILKWGLRGSKLYRYVFVMCEYIYPQPVCTWSNKINIGTFQ